MAIEENKFSSPPELGNEKRINFDFQFYNPEVIKGGDGHHIEVIHVKPKELISETPVLVLPGWSGTAEVFKKTTGYLFHEGRNTY